MKHPLQNLFYSQKHGEGSVEGERAYFFIILLHLYEVNLVNSMSFIIYRRLLVALLQTLFHFINQI